MPPRKRKATSKVQVPAAAQPRAETRKVTAVAKRTGRRPKRSLGAPAAREPTIVPIRALATVKPSSPPERPNTRFRASVVPEMTAVSKPKRKPPSAATTVLSSRRRPPGAVRDGAASSGVRSSMAILSGMKEVQGQSAGRDPGRADGGFFGMRRDLERKADRFRHQAGQERVLPEGVAAAGRARRPAAARARDPLDVLRQHAGD